MHKVSYIIVQVYSAILSCVVIIGVRTAFVDTKCEEACIRHVKCKLFMDPLSTKPRCTECSKFRDYLRCALRRCNNSDDKENSACDANSHVNYKLVWQNSIVSINY